MDSSVYFEGDESTFVHLSESQRLDMAHNNGLQKFDLIVKDEVARRLKLRILILENENDDLHDQLAVGDDRIDLLEQQEDELRARLEQSREDTQRQEIDLRVQTRELDQLRTEVASMNGVAMDTTKVLTEKLSLARELATLKPELEHLRSQAAYHQTILSEKLTLQRQISSLEVELEAEKRAGKRAAKNKNENRERETELQIQLDVLQRELAQEKREAFRTLKEREAELQGQVDGLEKDIVRERKEHAKALKALQKDLKVSEAKQKPHETQPTQKNDSGEIEAELQSQLAELQKDLMRERKEASKSCLDLEKQLKSSENRRRLLEERAGNEADSAEREAEFQNRLDALQEEINREKSQASKAIKDLEKQLRASESRRKALESRAEKDTDISEKESDLQSIIDELQSQLELEKVHASKASRLEKELKATETHQSVLEGKVEQLRTKLRTAREQLKEAQNDVTQIRAATNKVRDLPNLNESPAKNHRKRNAPEMSTDISIGTPDGVAVRGKRQGVKRGRPDQTMVGEKSMFSITPFLNRTMSVAPESPIEESPTVENEALDEISTLSNVQTSITTLPMHVISSPSAQPKAKGRKRVVEKIVEKNVLGEAKPNIRKNKPVSKKPKVLSILEKVTEEDDDENKQVATSASLRENPTISETRPTNSKTAKLQVKQAVVEESGPKKKKRKLPGATLFDEEDGEATKRPAKITLGPVRLLGKSVSNLKGGLGTGGGFGAFSPLKKDRRGVGASFLA
ncbi:hypothetical protein BGZ60DRAFT_559717 [Tricladium varicosporioides]|nr:hypothetical protein BGZ60DRAFT_559717 [Hymenoscyphus varicosporioides]